MLYQLSYPPSPYTPSPKMTEKVKWHQQLTICAPKGPRGPPTYPAILWLLTREGCALIHAIKWIGISTCLSPHRLWTSYSDNLEKENWPSFTHTTQTIMGSLTKEGTWKGDNG